MINFWTFYSEILAVCISSSQTQRKIILLFQKSLPAPPFSFKMCFSFMFLFMKTSFLHSTGRSVGTEVSWKGQSCPLEKSGPSPVQFNEHADNFRHLSCLIKINGTAGRWKVKCGFRCLSGYMNKFPFDIHDLFQYKAAVKKIFTWIIIL